MTTVIRYPGSCIMFNMISCSRVKKTPVSAFSKTSTSLFHEEKHETLSQLWENDEDIHLIVRLVDQGYPWTVGHYGTKEIFKAPLVIPIRSSDVNGTSVGIFFRDFANRGDTCIKRKFHLEFASATEAQTFVFSHNLFLSKYQLKVKNQEKEAVKNLKKNKVENDDKSIIDDEDNKNTPIKKKRRYNDMKNDEEEEVHNKEKNEYNQIVSDFDLGDKHDILDDYFESTQDPYFGCDSE